MKKNILIVDDDISILDAFEKTLVENGYSIGRALNETEALCCIEKCHYHLAIVDIILGKNSGLELIDKIKAENENIIIVATTGYPSDENIQGSFDHGACELLKKPCDQEDLLNAINKAFNYQITEQKKPVDTPAAPPSDEDTDYGIDASLVAEFIDESVGLLEDAANMFITLESKPGDKEAIDTIFRTVHTIKGNASFFNLSGIKSMAHAMEDLMSLVRENTVGFNGGMADVLIRGTDYLNGMLKNIRNNKPEVSDESGYNALIEEITRHVDDSMRQDQTSVWKNIDKEIEFFDQALAKDNTDLNNNWQRLKKDLIFLSPSYNKEADAVQQESENIAEVDPKIAIEDIFSVPFDEKLEESKAQEIYNELKALKLRATDDTVTWVDKSLEAYNLIFPKDGFTTFLAEIIENNMKNVQVERRKEDNLVKRVEAEDKKIFEKSDKTMRVYESNIDEFLHFVGELVIVSEMYDHIYERLIAQIGSGHTISAFKKNNTSFNDLSYSLQQSVLAVRRVPIKSLVQKAPRIIRDISLLTKKKIKVTIEGEETLIDKSILESIEGPFVHMVRNSADHGIETIEDRIKKGKNKEGTVNIRISDNERVFFIEIKDDGAGINKEKIIEKAIKNGLISSSEAERYSEQEIFHLLFAPGISTAEQITDISGRGVGMDVVKQNVESINGQIHIESVLGQGSVFTLEIPKKVAVNIIEGFLVLCNGNKFVLPMINVGKSFELSNDKIISSSIEGECVLHHNNVFPVMRLDRLLGFSHDSDKKQEHVGVIIYSKKQDFVLLVDEVLGVQQVVVKNIEDLPGKPEVVTGGAVLGDERVALVLNLENI